MTLAEYVKTLMGETSINVTASEAGVSNGALHNILKGVTEKPTPDLLERLARYFGQSDEDRAAIYARMMEIAGHLNLMPPHLRPSLAESRRVKAVRRGTDNAAQEYGLDDPANQGHPLDNKEQNSLH